MQNDNWITYTSQIDYLDKLRLYYVPIPHEILEQSKNENDKTVYNQRFYISINDCEPWQAGVVSLGNKTGYISIKSAILKKLNLALGSSAMVSLLKDESEFGMPVSEELAEILNQDPEGEERFRKLPLGKQRYIIYYVNQVKSSQKKIERAWLLISNLKKCMPGKESFREILGK